MHLDITFRKLHLKVLVEIFKPECDYEITSVLKNTRETWTLLIAAIPKQTKKMKKNKIPYQQEVMHVIILRTIRVETKEARDLRLIDMKFKKKSAIIFYIYV